MSRVLGFKISLAVAGLACSASAPPPSDYDEAARLAPGADSVLAPLAQRVDRCLAASGGAWGGRAAGCMCPPGAETFRGAPLACHVGPYFVAFDGLGLPFLRPASERARDGPAASAFGLAYVPAGRPPEAINLREFSFGGFATLDDRATELGPRWYRVGICRMCD